MGMVVVEGLLHQQLVVGGVIVDTLVVPLQS